MRGRRSWFAAAGLLMLLAPAVSRAQGVAFQPTVAPLPDGVSLDVTPVVSADRRYVRMTINPNFQTITGFQTYSVPAAVSGGLGGGGLGGFGGAVGMNGPVADGGPGYAGLAATAGRSGRAAPARPMDLGSGSSAFASSFSEFVAAPDEAAPALRPLAAKRRPSRAVAARPARVGPG